MTTDADNTGSKVIKFNLISDIHLECRKLIPGIVPTAPYLALCGDIGDPFKKNYAEFLKVMSEVYERVFVVTGNHEYYSGLPLSEVDKKIEDICKGYANVDFLQKRSVTCTSQEGVDFRVLGCTLWAKADVHDVKVARRLINDFSRIRNMTPILMRDLWMDHIDWLDDIIDESELPTVVLTHHAPALEMLGKYRRTESELMNSFFASDCHELFREPVKAMFSGHLHSNVRTEINRVQCVSNCFGYPGQRDVGYRDGLVVEVPVD